MTIPSIIPGAAASTENSPSVESTIGERFEGVDFSNLLASLVAAPRQTVVSAESAADVTADTAESVDDNDQVAQEPDESALDPSALFAFIAPFSPTLATIAAPEPTTAFASETAAIAVASFTEAVKIDADDAADGDTENYQADHSARFSLPLEPPAAAALVQNVDSKTARIPFANEESHLTEVGATVGIAVPLDVSIDTAMLEQSEFTQREELSPRIVESRLSQDSMKPADVLDAVASSNDSPAAAPKELRSSGSERAVKPAERQSIDTESFALESTAIEELPRQVRPAVHSQSSFANQHEESPVDHFQLKPREILVDPQDAPPQRLVAMAFDAAAAAKLNQENVVIENPGTPAWRPVVQRVSEQIVHQVRIGKQQAVIELEPPELGKIKIDLRVEGEQIHARIVAEEQGTKALIESRLGELRQALEVRQVGLANLQVEQQNVSSGGAEWGQTLNDGSRQGRGPWQDDLGLADRSAIDAPQGDSSQSPASDPGRISMWA